MNLVSLSGYIKCLKPWTVNKVLMTVSLSLSLGIFFFLTLYVNYATGLNTAFADADRIYRLINERSLNEQLVSSKLDGYPVASALQAEFPDVIDAIARLYGRGSGIEVDGNGFPVNVSLVDAQFFRIFQLISTQGDLESITQDPRNIAIEANFARTVFGSRSPLGELITLNVDRDTQVDYVVTAVFEYPKGNLSISYPLFALLDPAAIPEMRNLIGMWTGGMNVQTFVLAKEGVDIESSFNQPIKTRLDDMFPGSTHDAGSVALVSQRLQSIRDIQRNPVDGEPALNDTVINALRALAVLVYVSGLVNIVLLTVSNYAGRTKEFSVRRAAGSSDRELLVQLGFEAMFFTASSAALIWLMTESALPVFGAFVAVRNLEDVVAQSTPLLIAAFALVMIFLIALPYALLRDISPLARARFSPRNASLNIAQRASLAGLVLVAYSTLTIMFSVNEQMQYLKSRGLGLDPRNVYSIELLTEGHNTIDDLVLRIGQVDGVSHVTRASTMGMTQLGSNMTTSISVDNSILGSVVANKAYAGPEFFDLYGMTFLAGTAFDTKSADSPDELRSKVIINERLAETLGFSDPASAIGEVVYEKVRTTTQGIKTFTFSIAGVIGNTKFFSLVDDYEPEAYFFTDARLGPSLSAILSYRIDDASTADVTASVKRILAETFPNREFAIYDSDFAFQLHYSGEDRMLKLYKLASLLTGLIALLTLYCYLEFHVKSRSRTLAIRRVLGEGLMESFGYLLNRNALLNGTAILVGAFYSYAYVVDWLQQFTVQLTQTTIVLYAVTSFLLVLLIYATMNVAFAIYLSNKRVIEDLKEE